MDNNPSGADNNDINQLSSMSTPIVSTLTTATPITSEIVSDLEPDPKFEITPLEMASYDCNDIYSPPNLIENNGNSEVQKGSQQMTQIEQVVLIEQHRPLNVVESTLPPHNQQSGANSTEATQHDEPAESRALLEESHDSQMNEKQTSSFSSKVETNDCKSEVVEKDVTANIAVEDTEPSTSHAQAEFSVPNPVPYVTKDSAQLGNSENLNKKETQKTDESIPEHRQLDDFEVNTALSSGDGEIKSSDASNAYSMSQTSVDAQMEKVIDNIVELGGVHQFPQSLGHPEDKEDLLASIHREITSERSSIDLIADVASRQQSIEINPTIAPVHIEVEKKGMDEQNDTKKEVEDPVIEKPTTEEGITEQQIVEGVAEEQVAVDNVTGIKVAEGKVTEDDNDERNDNEQADTEVAGTKQKGIEHKDTELVAEKGEVAYKHISELEGTEQESTELDRAKLNESDVNDTEKNTEGNVEEAVDENVTGKEAAAVEQTHNERQDTKADEPKIEGRRTRARRTRGKKTDEKVTEEPCPAPVEEQPNSDLNKSVELPAEQSSDQNSVDDSVQGTDAEVSQPPERKERQSRSLRPRGSLKRAHDEDTPNEDPPKIEPPKKQVKKSRGSTSEHTPLIKLPNYRSRTTISTSDPISRLDKKYESTPVSTVQPETEKKFVCHQCGYATDRLNNLVYHSTKSFCKGKCQIGEVMKADIIRQQQQAKNKRRSVR